MDTAKLKNMVDKFKNQKKNGTSTSQPPAFMQMKSMIPMLSIKNIIIDSVGGTVIPWLILLFICTFLIII